MDSKIIKFIVTEDDINTRLDITLAKRVKHLTRSNLKKIIESKKVKINNDVINFPSKKIKLDDLITVNLETNLQNKIKASKIKLDILYEDKDILIVNKPAGMVVHPGAGNHENTLVNALIFKYKKIYQILMEI